MKKIISLLIVCTVLVSSLNACGARDGKESADVENSQEKTTTTLMVDESLLTVDVTIPADFFTEDDPATDVLTEEQKESGFKSAKLNSDGSVTYTLSKLSWKKLLAEYAEELDKTLNEFQESEDCPSIKKISHNNDFTKITAAVDREAYENSFDGFTFLGIYFAVAYYRLFSQKEPSCQIELKDVSTGEVFDTINYPEDFESESEAAAE